MMNEIIKMNENLITVVRLTISNVLKILKPMDSKELI